MHACIDTRASRRLAASARSARRPPRLLAALALAALAQAFPAPGLAQTQSAALEYYVQPDFAGSNSLTATATGMSLVNDLAGVTLTFNTGGFFAREFVSQGPIDFSADIDTTIPGFSGSVPTVETDLPVTAGSFRLVTPQGETIEGDVGGASRIRLVPYPPAPHVLFYELTLLPSSTAVTPPQALEFSMDEIKAWGILVTNGAGFAGAFGYGQNQQYTGSARF